MKFLKAKPPVPPYLHLGSAFLKAAVVNAKSTDLEPHIAQEWRRVSARVSRQPELLRLVFRRIDERGSDPKNFDDQFEPYYTMTQDSQGRILVEFYY